MCNTYFITVNFYESREVSQLNIEQAMHNQLHHVVYSFKLLDDNSRLFSLEITKSGKDLSELVILTLNEIQSLGLGLIVDYVEGRAA